MAFYQSESPRGGNESSNFFFSKKFFESEDPDELNWSRWFFPVINEDSGLRAIDNYLQQNIRFVAIGKHNNANYRIRYEQLRTLGYRSLVSEYYNSRRRRQVSRPREAPEEIELSSHESSITFY